MVTNPSSNANHRQARNNNRTNNITGQRNIANNSAHRKQYQTGIYKKDNKRKQINKSSVQNQRIKNTVHSTNAYAPAYGNMRGAAPVGAHRQNVKNIGNISNPHNYSGKNSNGAAFNRNVRNINNPSVAPRKMGINVNGIASGRAVRSIYSKNYLINEQRLNGQHTNDKMTNASQRRRHYLTGEDITTRIRRVKEKIADGRLYVADVLKQLFLFKSLDQSKVITKEKKKKAIPLRVIFAISICVIFIMTWIFSGMKLHENSLIIADNETEIGKLQKKIKTDEMLLEDKNDLSYIEYVAVNELGMIKKEMLPTQYISIGRSDEVELTNAQNTDYIKVTLDTLKDIFWRLK